MLTFTDPRLYVMGIGVGYMTSLADGSVVYWSDKMQEGSTSFSASDNVLSAGVGNAPAIIIPTDPNVTVNVTAADYSEYVKSASVGGVITAGAPALTCETVTAASTTISVTGTAVKGPGMSEAVAYVQEVGAASPIATGGIAYPIANDGTITGFTATSSKQYLVTYYVSQANATMTTINSNIKGDVVRFVYSRPIYVNYDPATASGDLYGWLHEIVPRLMLMPDGASNAGGQTTYTTTGITGRALVYDADTIEAGCNDCAVTGSPLMYRVIVPCDPTSGIEGVVANIGGNVTLASDVSTYQLAPRIVVDGKLGSIPLDEYTYSATSGATVSETGLVTMSGTSATVTVTYGDFSDVVVIEAGEA